MFAMINFIYKIHNFSVKYVSSSENVSENNFYCRRVRNDETFTNHNLLGVL